jgi:hypothetical protein
MKRQSGFFLSIKIAEGVIISVGERFLFLIAVVLTWIKTSIAFIRATSAFKKRVITCIPSAIANIKATKKSNNLIDDYNLCMMAPELNGATCMP